MKFTKILAMLALVATVSFVGCKPKDGDIEKSISEKMATMADMKDMKVSVADGVVTLTGECKDATCKENCVKAIEGMGIKGVKSVVSNCTIKPVVDAPASLTTTLDAATMQKVKDGLKDLKTLVLAGFSGKGAIINGTIDKAGNTKFRQMLASAKVLLDSASKITIK